MGLVRFSSRRLPRGSRVGEYNDILNSVLSLEISPIDDRPLDVDASFRRLGGVVAASSSMSPLTMTRAAHHAADGSDDFVVSIPLRGGASYVQHGRAETECRPGEAFVLLNDRPSRISNRRMERLSLAIPRTLLAPRIADLDRALRDRIVPTPALAYLTGYVQMLTADLGPMPAEVERLAEMHLCDLVALAIGATRESGEIARRRGMRAARLAAIKADVVARIGHERLSIETVSARHGISPQYVRALFNAEGTTFGDFVLTLRLARVHERLTSADSRDRTISQIVFEAGFGDLSYFNRVFRRQYGMTPSEARAAASGGKRG